MARDRIGSGPRLAKVAASVILKSAQKPPDKKSSPEMTVLHPTRSATKVRYQGSHKAGLQHPSVPPLRTLNFGCLSAAVAAICSSSHRVRHPPLVSL